MATESRLASYLALLAVIALGGVDRRGGRRLAGAEDEGRAMTPSIVALIPARAGSVRIPNKNIRPLAGKPLISYTIAAARQSGCFAQIVVSTDSEEYASVARRYGAEVIMRPRAYAESLSPDIEWLKHTLEHEDCPDTDAFAILRPTTPFRQAETIRRAWQAFCQHGNRIDSLRAVAPVSQHPGKMWVVQQPRWGTEPDLMVPLLPWYEIEVPWHSSQTANLPPVWIQTAGLEIAWTRVPLQMDSIAGKIVMPWFSEGYESVDLNEPDDWDYAEWLVQTGRARLPEVTA